MMRPTGSTTSAGAYIARDGRAMLVPNNVTTVGVGIAADEVVTLDRPSDQELGAAALRALGAAGRVVAHPATRDAFRVHRQRFLKHLGYRSHKALMRECFLVRIVANDDEVVVIPTDNQGVSGGYADRLSDALRVAARPDAIGDAIKAAAT